MKAKGIVAASMPKWISVNDALPEEFVSVIVYVPGLKPFPEVREGYRTPDGFMIPALFHHDDVSHWMPLPEPPKESAYAGTP